MSLYEYIFTNTSLNVIASGGVSTKKDIDILSLFSMQYKNLVGCVVGKAFYEGKITLNIGEKYG